MPDSSPSLQQKLQSVARGDELAFAEVFHEFEHWLDNILRAKNCLELKSEAWTKIYQALAEGRFQWQSQAHWLSWLHTVTKRTIIDEQRRRNRDKLLTDISDEGMEAIVAALVRQGALPSDPVQRGVALGELRAHVQTALAQLPEPIELIARGYYIEQMPLRQLAKRYSLSAGRARGYLRDAQRLLRRALSALIRTYFRDDN